MAADVMQKRLDSLASDAAKHAEAAANKKAAADEDARLKREAAKATAANAQGNLEKAQEAKKKQQAAAARATKEPKTPKLAQEAVDAEILAKGKADLAAAAQKEAAEAEHKAAAANAQQTVAGARAAHAGAVAKAASSAADAAKAEASASLDDKAKDAAKKAAEADLQNAKDIDAKLRATPAPGPGGSEAPAEAGSHKCSECKLSADGPCADKSATYNDVLQCLPSEQHVLYAPAADQGSGYELTFPGLDAKWTVVWGRRRDGGQELGVTNIDIPKPNDLLLLKDADGTFRLLKVSSAKPFPPIPAWTREACVEKARQVGDKDVPIGDGDAVVCVDIAQDGPFVYAPPANVVRPNQAILVLVRHRARAQVSVQLDGGTRGLATPAFGPAPAGAATSTASTARADKQPAPAGTKSMTDADASRALATLLEVLGRPPLVEPQPAPPAENPEEHVRYFKVRYSPRLPGASMMATIKQREKASGDFATVATQEIEVDTRYWGSVRTGVGAVFAPGSYTYDIQQLPGSKTWQVRQARVPVQPELVLAFAPYLEALSPTCRGRSYSAGSPGCNWHISPYLGFGVVGQSAASVSALVSFHAGVEVEFAQNFSVALTAAYKRLPVLADGYHAGSPIEAGATPDRYTVQSWLPAFGVFINATPSFFQFPLGSNGQ